MTQPGTSMTRDVQPPDLVMQVKIDSQPGRTRLVYILDSPAGTAKFFNLTVAGPYLQGSPEEFHRNLLKKFEQLGDSLDVDDSPLLEDGVDRRLVNFGRALWRELIPSELCIAYRDFRQSVHSWMISSEEPWIPWELMKPYDDSDLENTLDDDFLALRFQITRWLAGKSTPAREIIVRSLAALRTAELPQEKEEMRLLDALAQSIPGRAGAAPPLESARDLLSYLKTCNVQLLHFMGHGIHDASQADESGIPLPDGSSFRPEDLEGPVATQIRRIQPLVFMNTCWAAQQGWSLTRLSGWTSRWIGCGCSALVAPLWPVRDQIALSFAHTFYNALAGGDPLGEAARKARRQVFRERSGDPSVLAYAVYGHPHARVTFGENSSAEETFSDAGTRRGHPIVWAPRRRRWRWRPWWTWAASAVVLAGILNVSADPLFDRLYHMDVSPLSPTLSMLQKQSKPKPPSEPSRGSEPARSTREVIRETKVGGLRFVVSGGSSQVNSALRTALSNAAKDLPKETVSGWTVTLKLDPPTIKQREEFGTSMVSCRLTGEASAQGSGASIDLGPVDKPNSQTDEYIACNAAAKSLAKDIVSGLIQQLETKGET